MIKLKWLVFTLALAFFGALSALSTSVSATDGVALQISPASTTVDLSPGQKYVGSFEVANTGSVSISYSLSVMPFSVASQTYDPVLNVENSYTQITQWIDFYDSEAVGSLSPGDKRTIRYIVNVPEDVPSGGQYAAILVQTNGSDDTDSSIQVTGQVGMLLYAHIPGDTREQGEIVGLDGGGLQIGGQISVSNTIKNTGNVDFSLKTDFKVLNFFTGQELYVASTDTRNVLPDTTRLSNFTWSDSPSIGVFKTQQTVSFLDQTQTKESIVIICPLWLVLVAAFFVTLLVIWFILRIFSRRRTANSVQF